MIPLRQLGNKLRSMDIHTLGNKMRHGAQVLARKSVNTLARAADFGEKILPVAQGVANATGFGSAARPLLSAAESGLSRIKRMHEKAVGVRNALKGL